MRQWILSGAVIVVLAGGASSVVCQALDEEGELSVANATLFNGESDRPVVAYAIGVPLGQLYTLELESEQFDPFLRVVHETGLVTENDDGGEGTNSRVELIAAGDPDGDGVVRYRVEVMAFSAGSGGRYHLHGTPGPVGSQLLNETRRLSRRTIKQQPYDSVTVSLATPSRMFVSAGPSPQLSFSMLLPDGTLLRSSPAGPGWLDAPAGESVLYVYGPSGMAAGEPAHLAVYLFGGARAGLEAVVNDTLAPPDSRLPSGEYYQVVNRTFRIATGETLEFELWAPDFDTFLIIQDVRSARTWQDDDGGGRLNSRLRIRGAEVPEGAGRLRAIVTSAFPESTGTWTLRVTRVESRRSRSAGS